VVMMLMASHRAIMGQFVISSRLKILGWLATGMMALAVAAMLWFMLG
jgi:Mn2+/Fe2+ NRAMP family transporter